MTMTTDELKAWGAREFATRLAELAEADKAADKMTALEGCKDRAKQRRRAVGLSMAQASRAISMGRRESRS